MSMVVYWLLYFYACLGTLVYTCLSHDQLERMHFSPKFCCYKILRFTEGNGNFQGGKTDLPIQIF